MNTATNEHEVDIGKVATQEIRKQHSTVPRQAGRVPRGLAAAALWLAVVFGLLWILGLALGPDAILLRLLEFAVGLALIVVSTVLVARFVRRRMLWSLRNKLVLTYLLIGLAPVVLFLTLVTISAYIAAGQFAIHLADSRLQSKLDQMAGENANRTAGVAHYMETHGLALPPTLGVQNPPTDPSDSSDVARSRLQRDTTAYLNGTPLEMVSPAQRTPFGLPPWAVQLPGSEFRGLVLDAGELYLVAVHQHRLADGRVLSLVGSVPVDAPVMGVIAEGLGRVGLRPSQTTITSDQAQGNADLPPSERPPSDRIPADRASAQRPTDPAPPSPSSPTPASSNASAPRPGRLVRVRAPHIGGPWIQGGTEPPGLNLADVRVAFRSTVSMTDWDTGGPGNIPIEVTSRPSLLYRQLFGTSLGGIVTSVIRVGLIALCVLFLLIELLALVMAIRLSRTITASVSDLYEATLKIDRGELAHRIGVEREDQLAELSRSFNRMTGSLQRLLLEQKEKERLQSELTIAQEVQANLFPRQACDLPTLQLHGVCRPARSVSGDYYDFLVFHEEAHDGLPSRRKTGVGIALGDISGKGISAALLMATLHSAVRAYRFASEELLYSESHLAALTASREGRGGDCDELFQSPGRILSLLNRHLYRSTQPEKYATLFLAHYDAASAMLTYSNAGQLPPLILGRDGAVRRLDRGGTVVGLMDGMSYEEGRLPMRPGDILVAYSDGVTEPENDFGEFGEDRMMEVVLRYRDEPLHVISAEVMQALDAWIGAEEQPDDITLVLARQL